MHNRRTDQILWRGSDTDSGFSRRSEGGFEDSRLAENLLYIPTGMRLKELFICKRVCKGLSDGATRVADHVQRRGSTELETYISVTVEKII